MLKYYYTTPLPQHMPPTGRNLLDKYNTHFEFNGTTNRQKQGVAMGTKCAPTFTNLFMARLEQEFLDSVSQKGTPMPALWIRYIDDIFVIWPDTEQTFLEFFDLLNSYHLNIRYNHDLSTPSIAVLDLTVYTLYSRPRSHRPHPL